MTQETTHLGPHVWFNLGYDFQCGVCGIFFKAERDRLALRCEELGLSEAAAALRQKAQPLEVAHGR